MANQTCIHRQSAPNPSASLMAKVGVIDTRLVAAVQTRAGAKVHEAAGLLNGYYLWSDVLAQAARSHDESTLDLALPQVCAARRRLRQFLSSAVLARM